MLKKYLKKSNSINHYDNFTDIVIDIDWKSINYNRISFINKAVHKFINCKYLEIGCQNNDCFDSIDARSKIGVDPNKGGTIRNTSDDFFTKSSPARAAAEPAQVSDHLLSSKFCFSPSKCTSHCNHQLSVLGSARRRFHS